MSIAASGLSAIQTSTTKVQEVLNYMTKIAEGVKAGDNASMADFNVKMAAAQQQLDTLKKLMDICQKALETFYRP